MTFFSTHFLSTARCKNTNNGWPSTDRRTVVYLSLFYHPHRVTPRHEQDDLRCWRIRKKATFSHYYWGHRYNVRGESVR